jgi:nicotinate-nucleotide adenylyltransferase
LMPTARLEKILDWARPPGPVADRLCVGLLGGSFNPAHDGHVHISEAALKTLGLDYVWWLVSPQNPLKPERGMADFETRVAKAKNFVRHPRIKVTAIEAAFGTRFTIDTIRALQRRFPSLRFVWLMGSDNLLQISRWHRWQEIFAVIPVAVVTRPETAQSARSAKAATRFQRAYRPADPRFGLSLPPAWTMIEGKRNPASATAIRTASRG